MKSTVVDHCAEQYNLKEQT